MKTKKINLNQKNDEEEYCENDATEVKKLYDELVNVEVDMNDLPTAMDFQKDDPKNWHIEFMGGVSNLRARNYNIT